MKVLIGSIIISVVVAVIAVLMPAGIFYICPWLKSKQIVYSTYYLGGYVFGFTLIVSAAIIIGVLILNERE